MYLEPGEEQVMLGDISVCSSGERMSPAASARFDDVVIGDDNKLRSNSAASYADGR